jgi:hypothetical protein
LRFKSTYKFLLGKTILVLKLSINSIYLKHNFNVIFTSSLKNKENKQKSQKLDEDTKPKSNTDTPSEKKRARKSDTTVSSFDLLYTVYDYKL